MKLSVQMRLSQVIFDEYPKLRKADVETSAVAAAELANLMGCVMAVVLAKQPDQYASSLAAVVKAIDESAHATTDRVMQLLRERQS